MVQYRGEIDVETLQQEVNRLRNAIRHLERSNSEVQAAIQTGDDDRELHIALEVGRWLIVGRCCLILASPTQAASICRRTWQ